MEAAREQTRLGYMPAYRGPQLSPLYSPSPNQYFYSPYSDGHHPYAESPASSQDTAFMPYWNRSCQSSPGISFRKRYNSVSSSFSNTAGRRRPPRPKYKEEEIYFIWYHRVDLCQGWEEVRKNFNKQFPSRQRWGIQGIQYRFYRFIKNKKCPTLREQQHLRNGGFIRARAGLPDSGSLRFGVVDRVGIWYPWMRESTDEVLSGRIRR
ncbi:uncharacterized protein BO88DRAFT_445159 [Aspergillus vadensis CBS 113365]|uniref:Uncharacterized protein n=1 Tax=Aspergillus vadensis (strain CBS 113365 / IMI 142717 / IBT 24658) TaxID=1448311 RepID=A0A319B352_ASPVC|nr:hypothetical protein BO88DRAFT_445159 [Aspergillus vadensis CBS 113365]PYH67186.1 hypothetical protein BO88DRAFT_445159 [Aspergillus vadensis CBS 113365]